MAQSCRVKPNTGRPVKFDVESDLMNIVAALQMIGAGSCASVQRKQELFAFSVHTTLNELPLVCNLYL